MNDVAVDINLPVSARLQEGRSIGLGILKKAISLIAIPFIAILTIIAYRSVLNDFFNADDFEQIAWVQRAVAHPEMVVRCFHSYWMDCSIAKFYRPLVSALMYFEYRCWGNNGLGFHVTNLLLHLAATFVIWALVMELGRSNKKKLHGTGEAIDFRVTLWAFSSAGLFALYPLHPEAVSWIIGRIDVMSTLFCLIAFWCYLRWQRGGPRAWLPVSLLSFAMGLCSKEMAVTLPAVLSAHSFIVRGKFIRQNHLAKPNDVSGEPTELKQNFSFLQIAAGLLNNLAVTLRRTLPYWLLLGAYFALRQFALKTFIGGYDDSLVPTEGWPALCQHWQHSLQVLFFPVNTEVIAPNFLAIQAWQIFLIGCAAASVAQSFRNSATIRLALFILSWWCISLLPVFKLFIPTDSLQGTRMAYMCSAPLCIGLTFGIAVLARSPVHRSLAILWISGFLATAFLLLVKYNEPWAQSGSEIRMVIAALNQFYKCHPDNHVVHFVGIPNQIQGAFAGPGGSTLLQKPQLFKDVKLGKIVNSAERLMPFGFLRRSIEANDLSSEVYRWDSLKKSFVRFQISKDRSQEQKIYTGRALAGLVSARCLGDGSTKLESDGIIHSAGDNFESRPLELGFDKHTLSGWHAEIVQLRVQVLNAGHHREPCLLSLGFTNDLQAKPEPDKSALAAIMPTADPQILTIPMRGNISWSLGGFCKKMAIYFPQGWEVKLLELSADDASTLVPRIGFRQNSCWEQSGYVVVSPDRGTWDLSFDVRNVKTARSATLEISKPNALFEAANGAFPSSHTGKSIQLGKSCGLARLSGEDFPYAGIYQIRIVANDAAGKRVGLASDHMVVVKPLLPDRIKPSKEERIASSNLTK